MNSNMVTIAGYLIAAAVLAVMISVAAVKTNRKFKKMERERRNAEEIPHMSQKDELQKELFPEEVCLEKKTMENANGNGCAENAGRSAAPDPFMIAATKGRTEKSRRMKMKDTGCYQNRELSWLKFNERVLEEAESEQNPLCERLNFLSIYQSNLDEFFMVRVGSLHDRMLLKKEERENKTNMTAEEQTEAVLAEVHTMNERKDKVYQELMEELAGQGIQILKFASLNEEEEAELGRYFAQEIQPLLLTMVVGRKQPFPFLKSKDIYAVAVLSTKKEKGKLAIIPCGNEVLNRLVPIPSHPGCYMLAEELILHFLPLVFQKYTITQKSLIRITRNADIDADSIFDEELNYRDHMAEVIKLRRKLCPVRLEISRELNVEIVAQLCRELGLRPEQIFSTEAPMDLSFLYQIQDKLRQKPELFYEKRIPQKSPMVQDDRPMLRQVLEHDILLSYPYESINAFLRMLNEAAADETVMSIKMTLYRLAKNSKVVEALVAAAENGKQVDVLVELKARFDEENNIEWSRRLEDAGCHVIYGLDGLKVHSKLCLITIRDQGRIRYVTQIGTGNYNEKTSRLYTDLSLLTADEEIGKEAGEIFTALFMGETVDHMEQLLVAPKCLQNRVIDMIDEEIREQKEGREAYIGVKINSLTDKQIIDKLIEASEAGVRVDMIIRGINCIQSGIEGKTDHIHIISIVGRYLEHSRIYIFGCGEREKLYLSSADFMTRNTLRRVEVAVPVRDPALRQRLHTMFDVMLRDNIKARDQLPDGTYLRRTVPETEEALNAQEYFLACAYGQK
ncbi:MAG: polyphosphate kinase 1 [Clostridiales bacterium]|nr:polyphosphate kinase 1 [Clostridiales bacterium]